MEELHKVGWNRGNIGFRVMIFTRSDSDFCITVKNDNGVFTGSVDCDNAATGLKFSRYQGVPVLDMCVQQLVGDA